MNLNTDQHNQYKNFTDRILKVIRNRKVFVFLIFFAISSLLWFLNTLNKEYITEIEIPLRYSNIPNENELLDDYQKNLTVNISGHGYSILKLKMESFSIPLLLNLGKYDLYRTSYNANKHFILKSSILNDVRNRLGSEIEVLSIQPDSLFFNYIPTASRKVPIVLNVDYTIPNEYMLVNEVSFSPDSVTIYGETHDIDSITEIHTQKTNIGDILPNKSYNVLLEPNSKIRYNKNKVNLNFELKKFVENKIEISISPLHFPKENKTILIPDKTQITYRVPISIYKKIDNKNFKVVADFDKRKSNAIQLEVLSTNKTIQVIKLQPNTTYYLLERQ